MAASSLTLLPLNSKCEIHTVTAAGSLDAFSLSGYLYMFAGGEWGVQRFCDLHFVIFWMKTAILKEVMYC